MRSKVNQWLTDFDNKNEQDKVETKYDLDTESTDEKDLAKRNPI